MLVNVPFFSSKYKGKVSFPKLLNVHTFSIPQSFILNDFWRIDHCTDWWLLDTFMKTIPWNQKQINLTILCFRITWSFLSMRTGLKWFKTISCQWEQVWTGLRLSLVRENRFKLVSDYLLSMRTGLNWELSLGWSNRTSPWGPRYNCKPWEPKHKQKYNYEALHCEEKGPIQMRNRKTTVRQ